ncbi:MAG: aldolase, partial [Mycobacterium sp.]
VAMVDTPEQAAAAVAAARYAPAGVRSYGPLRASIGRDPAELQSRVSTFAMIETAAGLAAVEEICSVPGLSGIYVGPADLAISLGVELAKATTDPRALDAIGRARQAASAAGVVAGIHAGNGATGKELAALGFQMITLAAESQALQRGAAAHLDDAAGSR